MFYSPDSSSLSQHPPRPVNAHTSSSSSSQPSRLPWADGGGGEGSSTVTLESSGSRTHPTPHSSNPNGGMESSDNFSVVIRVRPPVPRELSGHRPYVKVVQVSPDARSITLRDTVDTEDGRGAMYARQVFAFDRVYDEGTEQQELYERSARPAVLSVIEGYNTTLMAYGQTGTGKTYTMEGFTNVRECGVIPRAVEELFAFIEASRAAHQRYVVRASYMQIYNEVISDLLQPPSTFFPATSGAGRPYNVRHTPERGVYVEGLSEWVVRSPEDVYSLIECGTAVRATSATRMSELSSRSHAVLTVVVEATEGESEEHPTSCRFGKMNIVDLAGSEKVRQAGVTGQRLEETKNINRSLHELGNVISALAAKAGGKARHIPFRNSILTSALRDSLGGNCKTTLIACISPALESYAESLSTLTFANRAKNIRNYAVVNEDADQGMLLRRYERELTQLRRQLQEQQQHQGLGYVDRSVVSELEDDRRRAVEALQQSTLTQQREHTLRRQLEQRIGELEEIINQGGAGSHDPHTGDEYLQRLAQLDQERNALQEDRAQVSRYKQLLLKQRDIMLNLSTRLNERDEVILQLQEEIDAYDAHVEMLEEQLAASAPAQTAAAAAAGTSVHPVRRAGSPVNQDTVGTLSKEEADAYVRAAKVSPGGTDESSAYYYRSDLNSNVILTADEKLAEVLMLQGRRSDVAGTPRGRRLDSSPAAAALTSAELSAIKDALRSRAQDVARRHSADLVATGQARVMALEAQLYAAEERFKALESVCSSPAPEARRSVAAAVDTAAGHFARRVEELQEAAVRERTERRRVARKVDRAQYEISHLLDTVSLTPQQRAEASRLWQVLRSLEDEALASANVAETAPSTTTETRKILERELAARDALWRGRFAEQETAMRSMRQQLHSSAERSSQRSSTAPGDKGVSKDGEVIAVLRQELLAYEKDHKALQAIMERRIKAKVDRMCAILANGAGSVEDDEALGAEAASLQRLVDAAIKAMST